MKTAALVAGCVFAVSTVHAEVELRAGVARVDITPTTLMQMYGYANRKCGPANGTHDPLFAKALVLEAGDSRLAIVTMDLGAIVSDNLCREVAAKLNIPVLLLSVSHDHSAPSFLPVGSNPSSSPEANAYRAELERKVYAAIQEASNQMFPARLGVGRGSIQLGYNRLLRRDDGRARALFDNLERVPYGPVDPEFVLLRVDDISGNPRALLVHYAAHPVVLGPTNCQYSADYPGAMESLIEKQMTNTQVMFVQGGAGDINPLFEGRSGKQDEDFMVMQKMGDLLGEEVLRANKDVKPLPSIAGPFRWKSEVLTFNDRWTKNSTIEIGITTVLLSPDVAIAATPGEPMHKLQKIWKEQ